jgi:hypothetical protein
MSIGFSKKSYIFEKGYFFKIASFSENESFSAICEK